MGTEQSSYSDKAGYLQYTVRNGVKTVRYDELRDMLRRQVSRTSVVTPGFHSPNRGPLRPNPFEFILNEYGLEFGHDNRVYGVRNETDSYTSGSSGSTGASLQGGRDQSQEERLDGLARNAILGKLKDPSVNVPVFIGERAQTTDLFLTTVARTSNAIRHLRRGDFVGAAKQFGSNAPKRAHSRFRRTYPTDPATAVANGWLELQYGWKPFFSDLYGACDALARRHSDPLVHTVHARKTYRLVQPNSSSSRDYQLVSRIDTVLRRKIVVSYGVTYHKPATPLVTAKELGITNPALVAWELVPFSFVVDWFLPIGTYLDTLDATVGLTFLSGYRTIFSEAYLSQKRMLTGLDNYGCNVDMDWESYNKYIFVNRSPLGDFPSSSIPRFKNPLSASHIGSAMALLHQLFRK